MFSLAWLALGLLLELGGVNGQFQFRCNYYAIGALYGNDTSDSAVSNCNVAVAGLNAELGSQFVRTSTCALIIRTRPP